MLGRIATAAVVCASAVLGPGPLEPAGADSGAQYVSLGDSYTAAPLVPPHAPGPAECARSGGNYPHLLAAQRGLRLTDVSCAGAATADLTAPRDPDIPAQVTALNSATALVTVGIGGNDHGLFSSVVAGCGSRAPLVLVGSPAPCRDAYAARFAADIKADAATARRTRRSWSSGTRRCCRATRSAGPPVCSAWSRSPRATWISSTASSAR